MLIPTSNILEKIHSSIASLGSQVTINPFKLKMESLKLVHVTKAWKNHGHLLWCQFTPSLKNITFILKITPIYNKKISEFKIKPKTSKRSSLQQAALGCNPTKAHWVTPVCQAQHRTPSDGAGEGSLFLFFQSWKSSKENRHEIGTSKRAAYYKR